MKVSLSSLFENIHVWQSFILQNNSYYRNFLQIHAKSKDKNIKSGKALWHLSRRCGRAHGQTFHKILIKNQKTRTKNFLLVSTSILVFLVRDRNFKIDDFTKFRDYKISDHAKETKIEVGTKRQLLVLVFRFVIRILQKVWCQTHPDPLLRCHNAMTQCLTISEKDVSKWVTEPNSWLEGVTMLGIGCFG